MKPAGFVVPLTLFIAGLSGSAAENPNPAPPRFSIDHLDRTVSPAADFVRFASGNWMRNNPIPADKSRWGGFDELGKFNWLALKSILERAASKSHEPGSVEQKVGDFFASAMDERAIEEAGLKPIAADLQQIEAIASAGDLATTLARLHDRGIPGLFVIAVVPDDKRSDVYALYARQGGMSLPSRDYYFGANFEQQRAEFVAHIAKLFVLAGDAPDVAATEARTVWEVEKSLAMRASTPVGLRDRVANYNRVSAAEAFRLVTSFPMERYLRERGISSSAAAEIVVAQPKFYAGLEEQMAARPFGDWKTYLRYKVLRAGAPFLPARFEQETFRFYSKVLQGTPEMEPRWQRAARIVDDSIGEALGELYVTAYYPKEARARMEELIANLKAVMRDRLQQADWMSAPTRQKALAKFDRFVARIGYPEKFRDYASVDIKRGDFFGNVRAATKFEVKRKFAKLGQPVDQSEWDMTPPTVNAYFQPTANQIVFPAGILQPPFFDLTLDDAVNYGAIGAVIGHEITHGFDDQGRRYDGDGNLADWWTPEDAAGFSARAAKLIKQFDGYEALPGLNVNGALSQGENIADLGGLSIAFEALQRSLKGKERKLIDGFTPEQRFFLSWAQQWRTNYREDALRRQVTVGPHAPGMFRAIGPLSNMPEFYEAFGIKEGDPLWRKPEDRVKIW